MTAIQCGCGCGLSTPRDQLVVVDRLVDRIGRDPVRQARVLSRIVARAMHEPAVLDALETAIDYADRWGPRQEDLGSVSRAGRPESDGPLGIS